MHLTARLAIIASAAALALAGCADPNTIDTAKPAAAKSSASATTPAAAPSTSDDPYRGVPADTSDPVEEPERTEMSEGRFGETGHFEQEGNTFTVTVGKPVRAKCQYASIGCDKPETGDRVINVPITFKNTGKEQLEVGSDLFVLEFADGTRVTDSDGNANQYGPDNTLDYGVKVRPGGTLKSSLTFEAPDGKFSVILLTNSWNGEDLFLWK